ncbi:MAG: PAS domain-containing sensor histidine kinase [Gemmatimonadaceae bacterium]|nr:PAS domain-containing sensor histidine kinase [Gemmatimonadaceae bacterium]
MTHLTRPHPAVVDGLDAPTDTPSVSPSIAAEYPKHEVLEAYAVLDAISDVVCVTTGDGTLRFLNRAGRDLLGYVDDESALIGCIFPAHTPAARTLLLDEVVPTALRLGQTTCDTALQTADGRVFPARQTVIVTPPNNGIPLRLTCVIRDVSIERQAAARLGDSQRLFEMIARGSPDLIYLYDPIDERIVWMNRCAHAFLGGAERDARTLSRTEMHRLVHRDDRELFRANAARMAAAYGDTDVLTNEMRMRTRGGEWRWINTRASVFSRRETGAPLLLLGIATDISRHKRIETRLIAERDAAERASFTRGEFVARMTDEFRAALHAIVGLTSEVRADRDRRLTARELQHLDEAVAHGNRLLETVSDLHDFSAIETGDIAVAQSLVDVRDVIRETVASFADHPGLVDTPLRLHVPEAVAPMLTDPVRLRQALTHLIGNALAFTPVGHVTVSLVVDGERQAPVAIDVQDTGDGIDAERHRRLFSPFEPSTPHPNTGRRRSAGTGLGLALARGICEMIGCTLSLVQSEVGVGSTFRIGLPVPSRAAQLAAEFPAPTNVQPTGDV